MINIYRRLDQYISPLRSINYIASLTRRVTIFSVHATSISISASRRTSEACGGILKADYGALGKVHLPQTKRRAFEINCCIIMLSETWPQFLGHRRFACCTEVRQRPITKLPIAGPLGNTDRVAVVGRLSRRCLA